TTFESELMGGEHEGKKALVKVKVLAVKERQLPEADDDFAQVASQFDTLAELKADLKNTVLESKKFEQFSSARTQLVDTLIEKTKLEISDKIIEDEVHRHLEQEGRLEDEAHRAEVTESSQKMLRQQLILDKIAETRDVKVSQDDFGRYVMQNAAQYGIDPNEYVKLLDQQGQVSSVVADLARSKAISQLLGEIKVTDKSGTVLDFSQFLPKDDESSPLIDILGGPAGHDHDHDHDH
ncbi:MAG: trigger factor, partial [Microbacteriaceae bacterium]